MCWFVLDSNRHVVWDSEITNENPWIGTFKSPEVALNVVITHNVSESQNAKQTMETIAPSNDGWTTKVSW